MDDNKNSVLDDAFGPPVPEEKRPKIEHVEPETALMIIGSVLDRWLISLKDRETGSNRLKLYYLFMFAKCSRRVFGDTYKEAIREKFMEACDDDFDEWYKLVDL